MLRILSRNITKVTARRAISLSSVVARDFSEKVENTENQSAESENAQKLGGFAKAFEKYTKPMVEEQKEKLPDLPFATLLRNSKLIEVSCLNCIELLDLETFVYFFTVGRSQEQSCGRKDIPHCRR